MKERGSKGHMYNSNQIADDLRTRLQGKKIIGAKEIVELGLVKSEATLTHWRAERKGPPCFRLSAGKFIYPVDGLLNWLSACYIKADSDSSGSISSEPHNGNEVLQ